MFVKGSPAKGIYLPKPLNKQFYRLNSIADYVYCVNKIKKGKVNVKRACEIWPDLAGFPAAS
jgi:hypothetical protein